MLILEDQNITKQEESKITKQLKDAGFTDREIKQIIDALKKAYNESIKLGESVGKSFSQFMKEQLNLMEG